MATDAVPIREAHPERLDQLEEMEETVFHGKREVVRLSIAALLARGHVLIEDIPGVGKTTLTRALATTSGLSFRRIQFTSDLLPSDVLGLVLRVLRIQPPDAARGPSHRWLSRKWRAMDG